MKRSTLTIIVSLAVLILGNAAHADVNEQVREAYLKIENDKDTKKKDGLTPRELQLLFNYARDHKVAALTAENIAKYDPTGEIGYCYGRSMAVHLRARRMGLKPEHIRKLFIIGDLRSGVNREWRFHVTTLVKGNDGLWYGIDPLLVPPLGKNVPLVIQDWIASIRKIWDKKGKALLYMVDSNAIVPEIRVFPWEVKDEKGDKLIELTFNPSKEKGFTARKYGKELVYKVDQSQQAQHFIQAKEAVDADQFDFTRLKMTVIDGEKKVLADYDYHHYFEELVDDIGKSVFPNRRERPLSGATPEGTEIHNDGPRGTEIHRVKPVGTEIHGTEIHGTEIHGTEIHGTEIHYGSLMPKLPNKDNR